jgi:hypothetical protein
VKEIFIPPRRTWLQQPVTTQHNLFSAGLSRFGEANANCTEWIQQLFKAATVPYDAAGQ